MKTYVVDTNIILDDVYNLFKLYDGENNIIIPETVVDELDSKKSFLDEVGFQAREFARLIDTAKSQEVVQNNDVFVLTEIILENLKLSIVSKKSYQFSDEPSNILNDRKIIEVAKLFEDSIFVTFDSMCRIRAISEGLKTETLGKKEIKEIQSFKELFVNDTVNDNDSIFDYDKDYKIETSNYLFNFNDGNKVLARIKNDRINLVDTKKLERQDIKPLNIRQKFFVDAMLDPFIDICILNALAGTGKSLLAVSTALRLVKEKRFSKIVYIRNSVESLDKGEDVGYLSGNEEKFAVYNHPLYDSLEFIVRKKIEKSNENKSKKTIVDHLKIKEEVQNLIESSGIGTMWVGELRGRTISDAFVIIDECLHEEQKIITDKGLLNAKEIAERFCDDEIKALSRNPQTMELQYKRIISLKQEHISDTGEKMFEIIMANNTKMKLTGGHKLFLNDGSLIKVKDIKDKLERGEGVILLNVDKTNIQKLNSKVLSVKEIPYESYIYTPQIEDNENYVLENNILSKNCQNISKKTMQLILSRVDKDCKVVVIGSTKQIDNPYINKFNNSLTSLVEACKSKHNINLWCGELTNVVRGPITEFAENVFTK